MKKLVVYIVFISTILLSVTSKARAQSDEAQQLLLDVEKLTQLKQILKDLKTGYEIVSKGYNTIRSISEGNFNLHQRFLNSLLEVNPVVRNYKKVTDIIRYQLQIVKEYKTAFKRFKESGNFNLDELDYMGKVYSNLFNESLKNLGALATVLTAGALRMSDDERLTAIDNIYTTVQDKLSFLRYFNNHTSVLALQRAKEKADTRVMQGVYGITK